MIKQLLLPFLFLAFSPIVQALSFQTPLEIHTQNHVHSFQVSIARTPQERYQGLRGYRGLMPYQGMLFLWPRKTRPNMEMLGVLFPLDILFLDDQGRILEVALNLQPLSSENFRPHQPISQVLELWGGTCAQLGIHVGNYVKWRP